MRKITIVGLGAGDLDQLPLGVYKKLKSAEHLFLRTKEHPAVLDLEAEGMSYQSFDEVYEQQESFEAVYEEISEQLLEMSGKTAVTYAVPGHPLVAEQTVQLLISKGPERGVEVEITGGQSFLDAVFQALAIDPIDGFQLLDGTAFKRDQVQLLQHTLIGQVYDSFVASNVKLTLMEKLPDDYEVFIVTAAGSSGENIKKVPLFELDRQVELNNLTSVYVPPVKDETILNKEFFKLREIISVLRGPKGCPWDKKQTHSSLKKYLIEEAYELIEAINSDDIDHMIEELGDVLLQVMLHAQIGEDEGFFNIADIIDVLSEKMIRRHPHVFGTAEANDVDAVMKNWQEIKREEKGNVARESLLDGVSKGQPNIMRAYELQKAAAKVGFDWKEVGPMWEKVKEEIEEFTEEAEKTDNSEKQHDEFGDLLFALVNVARFYNIQPEEALLRANSKFTRRFRYVEAKVNKSNRDFSGHTLEQLDAYWDEAKQMGM
ncbi:nucleoside triphosphate pyrophosphohydrolase [Mesobacillus harenae]|uniref:nucleoside triphosphate pyrophosphohydrolase n=1 Tax=Mesobacillus harenae TaxID=2213203 RepID=UPI001580703A|nr:nucleoside triphosphate pyrophosphohydrolase [Mesobacillus harenae]